MKTIHTVVVIVALIVIQTILSVQLIRARRAIDHPCFCDTCVEEHYEAIRKGNPQAKLEAL